MPGSGRACEPSFRITCRCPVTGHMVNSTINPKILSGRSLKNHPSRTQVAGGYHEAKLRPSPDTLATHPLSSVFSAEALSAFGSSVPVETVDVTINDSNLTDHLLSTVVGFLFVY